MEQMQPQPIPHLLQVYPSTVSEAKLQNPQIIHLTHPLPAQGKVTYQQTITSDMQVPSSIPSDMGSQNHVIMSCQQTQLQTLHHPLQGPVLQTTDMNQQMQITSHMLVPSVPLFKQQMLVSEVQQFYGQYEFAKEHCIVAKVEPEGQVLSGKKRESKQSDSDSDGEENMPEIKKKKSRNRKLNPSSWACNVRKLKHQRGEAYIDRRGKYVPERKVKNIKDCRNNCKLKCNKKIPDSDRELLFRAFYSLTTNEKKHFLLNTTERHTIKTISYRNRQRNYTFKYFFILRAERYMVCKNFYLGTLSISQKPIYNVHKGKTETNLPKPDGRGCSLASKHTLSETVKDRVRRHILSFTTVDSKPVVHYSKKKQCLSSHLSVKKMYSMYLDEISKEPIQSVKMSMYRNIYSSEFNLHITKVKKGEQLCARCKGLKKK